MKILLATPAHGGQVCAGYHKAVLDTLLFFKDEFPWITFESKILSLSLLPRMRNIFASMVLNDPSYTHLLFVDSDMGFWPELIANMIAYDKPVTGVAYPKRQFKFDEYFRSGGTDGDPVRARVLAADYIGGGKDLITMVGPNGERAVDIRDGFVRAQVAGTGILLIQRGVIEAMREQFPELWVPRPELEGLGLDGGLLQIFEPMDMRGHNGLIMGEDFAFCRRWVEGCGGEIWVNVDQPVLHIGQEVFAGKYLHKLEQMAKDPRGPGLGVKDQLDRLKQSMV